mgnify:CR=1 FL=1
MGNDFNSIVWSEQAEGDLDDIYNHYMEYSPETAGKRILEILSVTDELQYANQWEVDEFDSSCRRIIVKKKFRVLYREINNDILITRVYPNKVDIKNKK